MPKTRDPGYALDGLTACTRCPRLVACREHVGDKPAKGFTKPDYWAKPVPAFGDADPRLLVLGLAPGAHGANRTGRPFTGDAAGTWLYPALYEFGFATGPKSVSRDDGLRLLGARITNAVKCVPPGNKPTPEETATCAPYLAEELAQFKNLRVVLALGSIATQSYARWAAARGLITKPSAIVFSHGGELPLANGHVLITSYHCSRQNTNTGRLTRPMWNQVFARAREIIDLQSQKQ